MYSKEHSAEFLRALINGSDDAIISKTLDGNITGWNPAAEKIFGFSEDEIVGKSVLNLFPEELHHEESSIIAKIKSGQRIHHYETIRRRKDGSNFPASITVSPIQDDSGHIVGVSKIVRDISERKELEDQIRLSATVFEYAREAIIIADIEGRFIHVNNSFTQITGYSIDEVIGKTPTIFKSSRQGPDVQLKLLGDLQANGKCQGEIWSRRKNGEAFAALVNVTRVTEPDGMPGRYIAIFADITVMQEQKELMERMAYFDLLTNLPNRILLAERLETSLNRVNRNKTSLAVVYLDLDGFKDINDKFGHSAGDEVLATVSKRMLAATRESDTLARIGGDEFVILIEFISGTDEHLTAIHRILAACKEEIQYDGIDFVISASAGVTVYPDDNSKSEQLLRHADQAMYQAKQAGRDRVQFFDTHQDLRAKRKYTLIADVENALTSGELFLMYQPKVDIVNGEIIGAEALIRWKTNDGRVISPLEFIRPIEELPLIDEIGIWLIKSALLEIERLATLGLNIPISVNIAPRHFLSQNFVHDVSKLLEPYRELTINQNLLEFEIVETQKFFDLNIVSEIMRECTDIGVQFSLDDFGTGYSSLLYLKELPIHTLKIDRSFVTGMVKNTQELLIVKAVINLAKAFDKAVIAEGVETLEQAKLLVSLGCQNIQGYGIARPMTKGQFERWCYDWYLMERDNIKVDGIYFRGLNYDSASKSL